MNAPCKGCTRRQIGCHAKCEDYKSYCKVCEDIRAARLNEMAYNAYQSDLKHRIEKGVSRRK